MWQDREWWRRGRGLGALSTSASCACLQRAGTHQGLEGATKFNRQAQHHQGVQAQLQHCRGFGCQGNWRTCILRASKALEQGDSACKARLSCACVELTLRKLRASTPSTHPPKTNSRTQAHTPRQHRCNHPTHAHAPVEGHALMQRHVALQVVDRHVVGGGVAVLVVDGGHQIGDEGVQLGDVVARGAWRVCHLYAAGGKQGGGVALQVQLGRVQRGDGQGQRARELPGCRCACPAACTDLPNGTAAQSARPWTKIGPA